MSTSARVAALKKVDFPAEGAPTSPIIIDLLYFFGVYIGFVRLGKIYK
jgi:hypothetical protein